MNWKEIDRNPLVGELNTNYFVAGDLGDALMRVPRKNKDILENLVYEYRYIGFTGSGGRLRRRTPHEQFKFSSRAATNGLLVLPPLSIRNNNIYYSFLSRAQTLDQFFKSNDKDKNQILVYLITDLRKAHSLGFIYGDRWAGNMLVDPQFGLIHIDFDIEISGPFSKELDIAQVAYHTLWSGGEIVTPLMARFLAQNQPKWFDADMMTRFMRGLAVFLDKTKVGNMENGVASFIDIFYSSLKNKIVL